MTYFNVFQILIQNVIIPQSDIYAQRKGIPYQTTADEIKAFLGVTILMGYHRLPSMRDYYARTADPDLSVPFVKNVMSRDRFELIRRMLHFNDNADENLE